MLRMVCLHKWYSNPDTDHAPGRLLRAADVNRFGGQICDRNWRWIEPAPGVKAASLRRFRAFRLESEHRQLIERVDRLQADQEKRCDHQIIAEMHRTACNRRLACGADRAGVVNQTRWATENTIARRNTRRRWEAESFRRRGSNAFVANPFNRRPLVRRQFPARSRAVENPYSPQHDDDGRYQRSRRQYTFYGSDSHTTLRFPAPSTV